MIALTVQQPADPLETLAFVRRAAWLHRAARAGSTRQAFGSWTIGWRDCAGLVAVVGLYPLEQGAECWLLGDADRARPHLVQIARQTRLTLAAWSQDGLAPILACVRGGWTPGRRLAALTGFVPLDVPAAGRTPVDWFVFRNERLSAWAA